MIFSVFGGRYTTQTLNLVLLFDKTQEMYSKEENVSAESNLGLKVVTNLKAKQRLSTDYPNSGSNHVS